MGKGRPSIQLDTSVLVAAIQRAEANGPLPNRNLLWQATKDELAKTNLIVSTTFIYQKVQKLGINVITPVGKKGRVGGNPNLASIARVPKTSDTKQARKSIAAMKTVYDEKHHRRIDRLKKRSFKAAVYLKCLDCCGHEASEIAKCSIVACPLYLFRKRKSEDEIVQDLQAQA